MPLTVTREASKIVLSQAGALPSVNWSKDTMFAQRESYLQLFCLEEAIICLFWLLPFIHSMAYHLSSI
jgi:hypothetical protein